MTYGKKETFMVSISEKDIGTTQHTLKRLKAITAVTSMQSKSLKADHDKMTLKKINAVIKKAREK
jgi:hypothetical protein